MALIQVQLTTAATAATDLTEVMAAMATAVDKAKWPGMARRGAGAASDINGRNKCPV